MFKFENDPYLPMLYNSYFLGKTFSYSYDFLKFEKTYGFNSKLLKNIVWGLGLILNLVLHIQDFHFSILQKQILGKFGFTYLKHSPKLIFF
jgi:hypothetical protein